LGAIVNIIDEDKQYLLASIEYPREICRIIAGRVFIDVMAWRVPARVQDDLGEVKSLPSIVDTSQINYAVRSRRL
jgi:hypothetical protein